MLFVSVSIVAGWSFQGSSVLIYRACSYFLLDRKGLVCCAENTKTRYRHRERSFEPTHPHPKQLPLKDLKDYLNGCLQYRPQPIDNSLRY